ncbi:MAG: PAS domain S-box protein, partial [Ignavibacteriae bacterium]|nr:PAS domain S-box protein [Ignavibacteriota bacterium]
EERFQFMTTLEKSLNEIYIFDAVSLKFEYVNDSARRNLGYSSEELSHLTPIDIKSEYTEATFHEAVRPLLDHTKQHLIFETIHRRADGSTYPVEVHLQLVEQSSRRVFLALIYDITERKEEQKKIQFLANALESATDAISITDIDGKFIYANNAFLRLYGYSKEEVLGKTVLLVLPSSFPQQMPKSIQQATLKGGWRGELINRRKDGTEFPISLGTSAMKDQLGNVLGLVGVAKDITERKRIEAKLRFNEELYRDLVENINDVYFVTDARGKLTYASPNMFIHTGYTQEEIIGKSYIRLIADEDRGRIVQHYITCTNNGTIDTSIEFRVRRKDGTSVWAEQSTRIVRDAEGKPIQYSNVVRDITGRKLAGTALKVSEASLKEAQRIARMGNWKLDLVQNILTWSDEIYRIFEIDPARFGASYEAFLDLVHPEDREMVNRVYTESVKNRTPYDVVHRLKFSDERIKFVHERCETFYNEQGLPISSHGTVQDVTERIKMEENQKVLQSQLIQAQKLESLGTLASGIAHDFNNILTMVIGHASLLDRKIGTDSGVHESLGVIQQAAQRGASLVRQLLTFARKTETSREAVNINSMVNEVAKFIGETFPKTVRLSIHPANKLPFILADSTQIHQVLMNFCVNARDAMPNGGILSISTNVIPGESIIHKFPGATNPEYIELCVCDTGTGMDEGTVRRIFEPFFTTKELGKGTGLGLSVVSGIVETHGGFIDVSSTVGKGTTFSVYLPVQKESGSTKLVEEVKKEIPGGTEIILVIEDEVILMNLLTGLLEAKGYTVLTAYDGEEGIQKYVAHYKNISVVLSDLGLPKQSGEGVVKSIMSFNPKANVVVASGYIDPFVKSELYKAGVRQFIQKPYAPNELLKTIRETIDSKK